MNLIERLFQPQPPFETGHNLITLPSRVVSRLSNPEQVSSVSVRFSEKARRVKEIIESAQEMETDRELMAPVWDLLNKNLYITPCGVFLRASPFHTDEWLRDAFVGMLAVDLPPLEREILSHFEDRRTHPHLSTTRLIGTDRVWVFDDESTMLGLIWRAKLSLRGLEMDEQEKQIWRERWHWVKSHTEDGWYQSEVGTEKSWFDTYVLQKPDVLVYNQGVYAVAALAAEKLGLEDDPKVAATAKQSYRNLRHPSGRLQFSQSLPYKDVSSLFGEFLVLYLFNESFLPDKVVEATIQSLPQKGVDYPVVTKENDLYLDPGEFNHPYKPGDYQNGADWPVFTAMAMAVAAKHGVQVDLSFWVDLFSRLQQTQHAEYIYTEPISFQPRHNPTRVNHFWNTAVYAAAKMALDHNQLKSLAKSFKKETKPVNVSALYADAASAPNSTL